MNFLRRFLILLPLTAILAPAPGRTASEAEILHCVEEAMLFPTDERLLADFREGKVPETCRFPALTAAERFVLYAYTQEGARDLNRALRGGGAPAERARPCAEGLRSAMSKLPRYAGEPVWRGVDLPPEADQEHYPGNIVTYSAFTSTSKSPRPQYRSKRTLWIRSITGTDISGCSQYSMEQEVLFAPGARFKVLDRKDEPRGGHAEIWLEELGPEALSPTPPPDAAR